MLPNKTVLIGVAGGSGSGKTTICEQLANRLGDLATVLSCDNYYHSQSHLSATEQIDVNYDHPDTVDFDLLTTHLNLLGQGQTIDVPVYNFAAHARTAKTVSIKPGPMILVEGVLLFAHAPAKDLFDLTIFVDADSKARYQRRLRRDVTERGRTEKCVREQWNATVEPMYSRFVAPTQRHCDLTIHTDGESRSTIDVVAAGLHAFIDR